MASATIAILLMGNDAMRNGAHAYSNSIGMSRRYRYGALLPVQPQRQRRREQPTQTGFRRSKTKSSEFIHLFGADNDYTLEQSSETSEHDKPKHQNATNDQESISKIDPEEVFNNLLPSTMVSATNSRIMRGPTIGLSSSAFLPSSELVPQQNGPAFQFNGNPSDLNAPEKTTWKERLVDVSNLASLLCVLDCTLLPLVSIAIPALSWGVGFVTGSGALGNTAAGSNSITVALSSFLAYLPALSHGIALYFVIPVGLLTTIVNYFFGHKEIRFSSLSLLGVGLIYVANSSAGIGIPTVDAWLRASGIAAAPGIHAHGGHVHDTCSAVVGAATGMMAHTCPEGLAHRMTNTLGCAFLLGSNYFSKKYMEEKSQGCAASALAEAWGGDGKGRAVCPPGCNCQASSYGTNASASSRMGGETFFRWENAKAKGSGGNGRGRTFSRFRQ